MNTPHPPSQVCGCRWTRRVLLVGFVLLGIGVAQPALSAAPAFVDDEGLPPVTYLDTGVPASQGVLRGAASTGPRLGVTAKPMSAFKWQNLIRQETDIGCGAAALATILTYFFDFPTDELEMMEALHAEALKDYTDPKNPPPADVRQIGFNLRHVRNVAQKGGLVAAAFHVEPENLERVKLPVITRVTIKGYDHFVVFREAIDGRVYLADPAFGNSSYRIDKFERIWSGVMMGFLRRSEALPDENLLAVSDNEERQISWRDLMRISTLPPGTARFENGPTVNSLAVFDLIGLSIPGLRSAFPTLKSGEMTFGEDIRF